MLSGRNPVSNRAHRGSRVGAAIANAVFGAVGARVLRVPLTPDRVKAATKSG